VIDPTIWTASSQKDRWVQCMAVGRRLQPQVADRPRIPLKIYESVFDVCVEFVCEVKCARDRRIVMTRPSEA
jgi:hypothetical protein